MVKNTKLFLIGLLVLILAMLGGCIVGMSSIGKPNMETNK